MYALFMHFSFLVDILISLPLCVHCCSARILPVPHPAQANVSRIHMLCAFCIGFIVTSPFCSITITFFPLLFVCVVCVYVIHFLGGYFVCKSTYLCYLCNGLGVLFGCVDDIRRRPYDQKKKCRRFFISLCVHVFHVC